MSSCVCVCVCLLTQRAVSVRLGVTMASLCVDVCASWRHHNAMPIPSPTCRHVNAKWADQWDPPYIFLSFFFKILISHLRHSLRGGGGLQAPPSSPPTLPSPLVPSSSSQHCPLVSGLHDRHFLYPLFLSLHCSPWVNKVCGWMIGVYLFSFLLSSSGPLFSPHLHPPPLNPPVLLLLSSFCSLSSPSPCSPFLTVSPPFSLSIIPSLLLLLFPLLSSALLSKVTSRSEFAGSSSSLPHSQWLITSYLDQREKWMACVCVCVHVWECLHGCVRKSRQVCVWETVKERRSKNGKAGKEEIWEMKKNRME